MSRHEFSFAPSKRPLWVQTTISRGCCKKFSAKFNSSGRRTRVFGAVSQNYEASLESQRAMKRPLLSAKEDRAETGDLPQFIIPF